MSDQQAEQTSGETGSLSAGLCVSSSSEARSEPLAACAPVISVVEAPPLAPDHEAAKAAAPKVEAPKIEAPKIEVAKIEVAKIEVAKV